MLLSFVEEVKGLAVYDQDPDKTALSHLVEVA
jgi:hypothetical protein